jgi:[ribosomal protein S5]-alanine N-acetyltransferase
MAPGLVVLRALTAADRDDFLTAMQSSQGLHVPWLSPPRTPAEFAGLLRRSRDERFESLLVCRREDGAIAGFFNLSEIVRGPFQNAFLGYGAVAAHAGRGYMGEGLELLLAYAFGALRLHRLEANIQPGNAASIALVRGHGFVLEGRSERYLKVAGRWRDHERWAIRAEQWRARRAHA